MIPLKTWGELGLKHAELNTNIKIKKMKTQ